MNLGTLTATLTANTAQFVRGIQDAQKQMQGLQDSARAASLALGAAFVATTAVLAKATKAISVQREAEMKLAAAAKATGQAIDIDKIRAYAGELQKVTTFGDEVSISALALAATFRFTEQQLIQLLPRLQNMSTTYGMDLNSAAVQVGKAFMNSASSLARFGIVLSEAEQKAYDAAQGTERFALLMKVLDTNTGETARAVALTGVGAFKQFQGAVSDAWEEVGRITEEPIMNFFQKMTKDVADTTKAFTELHPILKKIIATAALGTVVFTGLGTSLVAMGLGIPLVSKGLAAVWVFLKAIAAWAAVKGALLGGAFIAALPAIAAWGVAIAGALAILTGLAAAVYGVATGRNIFSDISDGIDRMMAKLRPVPAAIKTAIAPALPEQSSQTLGFLRGLRPQSRAEPVSAPVWDAAKATEEFKRKQEAAAEAAKKFKDQVKSLWEEFMTPAERAQAKIKEIDDLLKRATGKDRLILIDVKLRFQEEQIKEIMKKIPTYSDIYGGGGLPKSETEKAYEEAKRQQGLSKTFAGTSGGMGMTATARPSNALGSLATTWARTDVMGPIQAGLADVSRATQSLFSSIGAGFLAVAQQAGGFGRTIAVGANAMIDSWRSSLEEAGREKRQLSGTEKLWAGVKALAAGIGAMVLDAVFASEEMKPVINALGGLLTTVGSALAKALLPALKGMWPIIIVVAEIMLAVVWGIAKVWNGILEGLAIVVSLFSEDTAQAIRDMKMDTKPIEDAMTEIWGLTFEDAAAIEKHTEATKEATEALTNIPEGFKVAKARFAAMAASVVGAVAGRGVGIGPIPAFASGGIVTRPTLALIGEAGPEAVVPLSGGRGAGGGTAFYGDIHVHGVQNPDDFLRKLERIAERKRVVNTGSFINGSPRFAF